MSELESCPKCKKGHLRPTGEVAIDTELEPSREKGSTRKYVCDNPKCEMHKSEYIPISDSASLEVTKAEELKSWRIIPKYAPYVKMKRKLYIEKKMLSFVENVWIKLKTKKFGLGHERVTGEIDSGRVQYMGGHKAFPKPVYTYVHFFDDRIELECYGGIKIYYSEIKDVSNSDEKREKRGLGRTWNNWFILENKTHLHYNRIS